MAGDLLAISDIFYNAFILPFGSTALASLVVTILVIMALNKFGIGFGGSIIIGGGFMLLFSWGMYPIDLTTAIVMVLMSLFAMAVLLIWRK